MKNRRLLEGLNQRVKSQTTRRYNLAEMISESYRIIYDCAEGTNMRKLAESHLADVKENPRDIERLSRQLCLVKEVARMLEANELKDEDLVDKKQYDEVEPKEERVLQKECNECDTLKVNKEKLSKSQLHEAEEPDLTDEELEELAKHLETIRKERKEAPKKEEVTEADVPAAPARRGIRCSIADSKNCNKEELKEESAKKIKVDIYVDDEFDRSKYFDDMKTARKWVDQFNYDSAIGTVATEPEMNESKSYKGLENFKKQSESKAFYKTFRKMHESLKEGKALTRQESIDLYKAANSALTQLSIELEHNPEFLQTFNESSTLLSADVNKLRESLSRGKAPSKATMKSLAKFSESLLSEESHPEYLADFKVVDTKKIGNYEVQTCTFSDHEGFGVQVVDSEGNPLDTDEEINDLTFDKFFKDKKDADIIVDKLGTILSRKYPVNESDEEDFVGDDEGSMQSEEADAFDQEYADARFELHSDLEAKHAEDEDPEVQEKLAQDAAEVVNLPGTTEEQIAQLSGGAPTEEEPEESEGEEESDEEEPAETPEEDDEITDDELAELKKHLQEMRTARRNK